MAFDLAAELPGLLPSAVAWANLESARVARDGTALTLDDQRLATLVGVQNSQLVRVLTVAGLPLPEEPVLRQAALYTGLLGPNMVGLTLGHSIFIVEGHHDIRLLSHELRHVQQYERFGSIAAFLAVYLREIAMYGYWDAPLEIDARANERLKI